MRLRVVRRPRSRARRFSEEIPASTKERVRALEGRAKERARAAILARVSGGALSLAAIDALARDYERSLAEAEGRCRVALETKRQSVFLGIRSLEETASTLRFATRMMRVANDAQMNIQTLR